jgi:oxygen-independent coproporphyrinogen-3 oxidase
VYLHVPFCATRCGYCDFNTYTAAELGGASPAGYVDAALAELKLAAGVLAEVPRPAVTVFLGGGTPTLLPPDQLARLLDGVRDGLGLAADAEVTTEANPESVDPAAFAALRRAGVTRVSLGMQSAVGHVLATLDRVHSPGRAVAAAAEARDAGIGHVSLDLIYGTPGETDADWLRSLEVALGAPVDHVSAYGLVVEDGTAMARRVARGELDRPDDDVLAARYEIADERLTEAGLSWYEVSNWARDDAAQCRHNRLYWSGGDWWGIGPGAHSHVGGVRWWNVRHPAEYADRLASGASPASAREVLDEESRRLERVLLGVRVRDGMDLDELDLARVAQLASDGLVEADFASSGRVVLTRRGRLLADAVVRALT